MMSLLKFYLVRAQRGAALVVRGRRRAWGQSLSWVKEDRVGKCEYAARRDTLFAGVEIEIDGASSFAEFVLLMVLERQEGTVVEVPGREGLRRVMRHGCVERPICRRRR